MQKTRRYKPVFPFPLSNLPICFLSRESSTNVQLFRPPSSYVSYSIVDELNVMED